MTRTIFALLRTSTLTALKLEAELATRDRRITELEATLAEIADAVNDKGPHPDHHDQVMARHRHEWPTLWKAIDRIKTNEGS